MEERGIRVKSLKVMGVLYLGTVWTHVLFHKLGTRFGFKTNHSNHCYYELSAQLNLTHCFSIHKFEIKASLCCQALALCYTTDKLRLLCYLPTGRQANLACQARNQAEAGDM